MVTVSADVAGNTTVQIANSGGTTSVNVGGGGNAGAPAATVTAGINPPAGAGGTGGTLTSAAIVKTTQPAVAQSAVAPSGKFDINP
jgi:hypothetical protein